MAKGFDAVVEDGKLVIKNEGKVRKFVDKVEQITLTASFRVKRGRRCSYAERAVFRLVKDELCC